MGAGGNDAQVTMEKASFLAAFPAIQTAIKITGNNDGMRIQLDIPENQMGEAVKVLAWREKILRVTIEPESLTDLDDAAEKEPERSGDKVDRRGIAIRRNQ